MNDEFFTQVKHDLRNVQLCIISGLEIMTAEQRAEILTGLEQTTSRVRVAAAADRRKALDLDDEPSLIRLADMMQALEHEDRD